MKNKVFLLIIFITFSVNIFANEGNSLSTSMFKKDEKWTVCQGYNGTISHSEELKYALDISFDQSPNGPKGCKGNKDISENKIVYAPITGTVARFNKSNTDICINFDHSGKNSSIYVGHLKFSNDSHKLKIGDSVIAGETILGVVENAYAYDFIGEYSHVHMQAYNKHNCPYNTDSPMPFGNLLDASGKNLTYKVDNIFNQHSGVIFNGSSISKQTSIEIKRANYIYEDEKIKEFIYVNDEFLLKDDKSKVKDQVIVKNGDSFVKSWFFKNTGNVAWLSSESNRIECNKSDFVRITPIYQSSNIKVNDEYEYKVDIKIIGEFEGKHKITCSFLSSYSPISVSSPYFEICSSSKLCPTYTVLNSIECSKFSQSCDIKFKDIDIAGKLKNSDGFKIKNDCELKSSMDKLCNNKIISGFNNDKRENKKGIEIKPNGEINRAELSKILALSMNGYNEDEKCKLDSNESFDDVKENKWFYNYICFIREKGIITGYGVVDKDEEKCPNQSSNGVYKPFSQFCPNNTLRYIESTKMILKSVFSDLKVPTTEKWYGGYVKCATALGLFDAGEYLENKPDINNIASDKGYLNIPVIRKNIFYSLWKAIEFRDSKKKLPAECKENK